MAIQKIKDGKSFNIYHQHFLIDNENELTSLEATFKCHMGDRAELPNGTVYVRHSDNFQGDLWELMEGSSGGQEGSNVLTINLDITTQALDKTWAEISAADVAVILLPVGDSKARLFVSSTSHDTAYDVQALFGAGSTPAVMNFTTNSADDYPILVQGD